MPTMKRIGVLGGISPQATIDFEARVHRVCQRLVPQSWNRGYPPMVVWYHRSMPLRVDANDRPLEPREIDPGLVEAAAWLGPSVDFLVMPCNAAHVGLDALRKASGRPVLSMIDVTVDEAARRGWRHVGVLGFAGAPAPYVAGLGARGIRHATLGSALQAPMDAGIRAVAEGREGQAETEAARAAVQSMRAVPVDGVVLGCTEIPLMLGEEAEAGDLLSPAALLAEAAVRVAIGDLPLPR
jgi:aspartate racemase